MITTSLIGGALGLFGSAVPKLMDIYTASRDRKHELAMAELQMKREEKGMTHKAQAIQIQGQMTEAVAIHEAVSKQLERASQWVVNLQASFRPICSYMILLLMITTFAAIVYSEMTGHTIGAAVVAAWAAMGLEGLVSMIIAHWFGSRAMKRNTEKS